MAVKTQFQGWNRNQPLVIYAKERYDELMNLYQQISKFGIGGLLSLLIFVIGMNLIGFIISIPDLYTLISVSVISIAICLIYFFRITLRKTIGNPINKEIDDLAKMEQDDIMKLNMEKVYQCLVDLSELIGYTKSYYEHLKFILYTVLGSIFIFAAILLIGGLVK